jgi:hypothetical protein
LANHQARPPTRFFIGACTALAASCGVTSALLVFKNSKAWLGSIPCFFASLRNLISLSFTSHNSGITVFLGTSFIFGLMFFLIANGADFAL